MILQLLVITVALQVTTDRDVEVTTFEGTTFSGSLQDWAADQLTLSVDGQRRSISVDELLTVIGPSGPDRGPAVALSSNTRLRVTLVDGSVINGRDITVDNSVVSMTASTGQQLRMDAEHLWQVRFSSGPNPHDGDWEDLLSSELAGDAIVIRRGTTATDYLEGIIKRIDPQNILFEFEGDEIEVARNKLEGIVYYHKQQPETNSASFVVKTPMGVWQGRKLRLETDRLAVETMSGVELMTPLDQLRRIDFSSQRVMYLADMEPASVEIRPYVSSAAMNDQMIGLLYAPRRNRSFQGDPIAIRGTGDAPDTTYAKGLAIHSRTQLVYRLDGAFQRLKAMAGVDPSAKMATQVRLAIARDGASLMDRVITADSPPVELDLDVSGAKRLTILVDYGDNWDADDRLHLANARLIK